MSRCSVGYEWVKSGLRVGNKFVIRESRVGYK